MSFRVFRILNAIRRGYALGVFWIYVAMFVMTLPLIFIFPPGALVMIFLGLLGLAVAVLVGGSLKLMVEGLARALISRGVCPGCADRRVPLQDRSTWSCAQCGAVYLPSGAESSIELPVVGPG